MKPYLASVAPLCLVFAALTLAAPSPASAQDQPAATSNNPPKVLEIITEDVKPGREGSAHEKTEAAFVEAMRSADAQEYYLGLNSVTGSPRAVFFLAYDSFADLQKDMDATRKNTSLSQAMDNATAADGALLTSYQTSIYTYRDDLSLRGPVDIPQMRYFEITMFHIRSGHQHDWETVVKMYRSAFEKFPDAHWATFEKMYGDDSGGTFIIVTPMKSLTEVDQEMTDDSKLSTVMPADQLQKMMSLASATIESNTSQLFAVNPKMTYAPAAWAKADSFWGQ